QDDQVVGGPVGVGVVPADGVDDDAAVAQGRAEEMVVLVEVGEHLAGNEGDPGFLPGRAVRVWYQRAIILRDMERHRSLLGRICSISSRSHSFSTSTPAASQAFRAVSVPSANWSDHSPSSPTRTTRAPFLPTYSMTAFAPPCSPANVLIPAVSVVSEPSAMTATLGRLRRHASNHTPHM